MSIDISQHLTNELEILKNIFLSDEITLTSPTSISVQVFPKTGGESCKITSSINLSLQLQPDYPSAPPLITIINSKGLDDTELDTFMTSLKEKSSLLSSMADSDGILFEIIDYAQELVTDFNDSLRGSCSICLEEFSETSSSSIFGECKELIRLDTCYHRFHVRCVYHDWYVQRTQDIGYRGDLVECQIPTKKCAVCRRVVDEEEAKRVMELNEAL